MSRSRPKAGLTLFAALLTLAAGCTRGNFGLPQVALAVDSPDGGYRATVRNHISLDPPRQSLWLEQVGGGKIWLRNLAEDQDGCDQAIWTSDGRHVAFVVQGLEVLLYSVPDGDLVQRTELAPHTPGSPSLRAFDLRLSEDGSVLTFRLCSPRGDTCAETSRVALAAPSGLG